MLDEAGYKKGTDGIRFPIDFVYVGTYTEFDRTARIIQAQLREVGIDVKLRPMEDVATIEEVFKKRNFGFYYESLTMGPDPAVRNSPPLSDLADQGHRWGDECHGLFER